MARVVGVGGLFFKSPDPKRLYDWYAKWLGMEFEGDWGIAYHPKDMPKKVTPFGARSIPKPIILHRPIESSCSILL